MALTVWNNVAIDVQSAIGSAVTIDSITLANPPVVGYTGTDPANGDYVLLKVTGMPRLNNRVFRIANVNTSLNTFELEAQDTTGYPAFISGTFQVITFGTSLTIVSNVQPSGGEPQQVDSTVVHTDQDTSVPGNFSQFQLNMTCQWVPNDAGLLALQNASDLKQERAIRLTYATGAKYVLNGNVACSLAPGGESKQLVTTAVAFTASGRGTAYYN